MFRTDSSWRSVDEIARHLRAWSLERWPFLPFADYSINCWVRALPFGADGNVLDSVCTYGPPLRLGQGALEG